MTNPQEHVAAGEPAPHAPAHHDSHAAAPAASPFTHAEEAQLQSDDLAAGRAIVGLMLAIFGVGVLLYAAVAYCVWTGIGFLS